MNPRMRKILALVIPFLAFACLQCGEKEGSLDPIIETEPPQYTIASLTTDKARIEPGEEATISAVVEDRNGAPVAGCEVRFSVADNFGSVDATDITDAEGRASVTYHAPAGTGVAVITVMGDDFLPSTAYVQVGEGILLATPASILADGVSTSTLYLVLVDGDGMPVEGAEVTFSLTPDLGTIYPVTVETDSSGYAEATYFSEPGNVDRTVTVDADIAFEDFNYSEFTNLYLRGISIAVDADPAEMPADGSSTSIVTVWLGETSSGAPIPDADVAFATTLGSIGSSATTDASGFADVSLSSGTTSGVAEVSAAYGAIHAVTYVTFGQLDLSLTAPRSKMVADGGSSQMVEAVVLAEGNIPVGGVEVEFSTSHGIITGSAYTNERGKARALLTSPTYAATATVSAILGGSSRQVEVSFENPVISLKASPMAVIAAPSNIGLITAYVSFAGGAPVPDSTRVRFLTSEGSISGTALTWSGMATSELRPSGVASGAVMITAICGNSEASTQAIFAPDITANVTISAMPDTIAGGGLASSTIVVEARDPYGNPVADGTIVDFTVTGGNGIVNPVGLTVSGIATARFTSTGGGFATVRATCETYSADVVIVTLSESAGFIVADPDTAWISVTGTGTGSSSTIIARVYDPNSSPVADGTDVVFAIDYGPGGGEYLKTPADGVGPVTAQTIDGMASVSVHGGTKPGTVLLSIEAGDYASATSKIGIAAGSPDSILINIGEGHINGDGTYTVSVSAVVRDMYQNPVENGTAVYFTLDQSNLGFINPEGYTGGAFPCSELEGTPIKGVSRACLTYPTESIFELYTVRASTLGGEVESEFSNRLPIFDGSISVLAVPASFDGTVGGVASIYVSVWDHYRQIPVDNATVVFTLQGDGSIFPSSGLTDDSGMPMATLTIPPGTLEGTTVVKAKVWMSDMEGEVEINISE